jgi:hypothetical protein
MKKIKKMLLFSFPQHAQSTNLMLRQGAVILSVHLEKGGTVHAPSKCIYMMVLEDENNPMTTRYFRMFCPDHANVQDFDGNEKYWHIGTVVDISAWQTGGYTYDHYYTIWEFK